MSKRYNVAMTTNKMYHFFPRIRLIGYCISSSFIFMCLENISNVLHDIDPVIMSTTIDVMNPVFKNKIGRTKIVPPTIELTKEQIT